jgi:hypothetical protein
VLREVGLKGINPLHMAAIERLQPYKGCGWTKMLRDLSNPDKHRQFVNMQFVADIIIYTIIDPEFGEIDRPIYSAPHPLRADPGSWDSR